MMPRQGRRIIAVAHFPPPVHGMAAAVERMVVELERVATVRRVTVAAPSLDRSAYYHLLRVARVSRALVTLLRERARSSSAFLSCDGGAGMVYTLALTVWARMLGYSIYLQHHSYSYLDHRSRVLGALVRACGHRCVHLVSCGRMQVDFRAAYPTATTRVVGVATGIEVGPRAPQPDPSRLVLGFFGNVSVDKGVDLAVATARAAGRADLPVELRVAGPVVGADAARLLSDAERDPDVAMTRVGPVYGADRDAFLDELDVFLFPSRYAHESFGLVAWEAMARGVPLLAYRSGCLTAAAVGSGGVVLERDDDFVAAAVEALDRWWRDPPARVAAAEAARVVAGRTAREAERQTTGFCRELAGPASPVLREG